MAWKIFQKIYSTEALKNNDDLIVVLASDRKDLKRELWDEVLRYVSRDNIICVMSPFFIR